MSVLDPRQLTNPVSLYARPTHTLEPLVPNINTSDLDWNLYMEPQLDPILEPLSRNTAITPFTFRAMARVVPLEAQRPQATRHPVLVRLHPLHLPLLNAMSQHVTDSYRVLLRRERQDRMPLAIVALLWLRDPRLNQFVPWIALVAVGLFALCHAVQLNRLEPPSGAVAITN